MTFKKIITTAAACLMAMATMTFTASAAEIKYGDIDGDGTVTVSDLMKIKMYTAGWKVSNFNYTAADVNCDGSVNNEDVELMKLAVVDMVTLPVRKGITYSFSNMTVPISVNAGSSFNLGGVISASGGNIRCVCGEILNSYGSAVMTAYSDVNGSSLDLRSSRINRELLFGRLPVGDGYTLRFTVYGDDDSSKTVDYPFHVQSKANNENYVYEFLRNEMGYNKAAAVAVLANINAESGFNPNLYGDYGSSYGICQWHNGRLSAMKQFCENNGFDYMSLYGQLKYLQYDLTHNYSHVDRYLRNVSDTRSGAYDGAAYFCKRFEVPANMNKMANIRGNSAMNTYWYRH